METIRPILLLTRPAPQSRRFAAEFRARFGADWPVEIVPLTEIVELSPQLPEGHWGDVIFTSENAVRAYARLTDDRSANAWCVGNRTASAAVAAGFSARKGPGDVARLCREIAAEGTVKRIFYPRPVHAAGDVEKTLISAGIETESLIVYDQRQCEPSPAARAVLQGDRPVLLPLFSPVSADRAARAFGDAKAPLWLAAISETTAAAASAIVARSCMIARHPTAESMLDTLGNLIDAAKTA